MTLHCEKEEKQLKTRFKFGAIMHSFDYIKVWLFSYRIKMSEPKFPSHEENKY